MPEEVEATPVPELAPAEGMADLFFQPTNLSEEQEQAVVADLDKLVREAFSSRGDLDNMLARWNDMAEGIAAPKNFPWPDSSNLFIPVTEIHLNNVHSAARQTLLKGESMYYVRSIGIPSNFETASKLERYLAYKTQVELPVTDRFSQLIWCAERDGTAIAQVQWLEDRDKVKEIKTYTTAAEFIMQHPTPADAGLRQDQYRNVLERLEKRQKVRLLEAVERAVYKGPIISVIQLADFLMAPMTAMQTKFARFVGKIFTMRGPELKRHERFHQWHNVDDVIASKEDGRRDLNTSLKDEIEGISRRAGNGEFVVVDGIHRYDLDGDGLEENYLVVYHPRTKKLLMHLQYPYLHNKDCFIPIRIKKRPNRFLGRGLCQMLEDVNSEINTQHNQRVDSRTITTVPTFKSKKTAKRDFDPGRVDSRFVPGRVFYLDSLDDVVQFDMRPTDLGESMNEESNLMQLADQQTGSSQLRSGKETKADPRAPAAKVMTLLQQSNIRMDDYFEELAGSAADNEGLNAIGEQLLELYYQFFDEDLASVPLLKPNLQPEIDQATGKPQEISLKQEDFLLRKRMKVQMAKTSAMQNPDALLLRFMQLYSLLITDPLVGGRPAGRLNLQRRLLSLAREENPDLFLPANEEEAAQAMGLAAMMAAGPGPQGAPPAPGGGRARTRNGSPTPGTPAIPGTTRPLG